MSSVFEQARAKLVKRENLQSHGGGGAGATNSLHTFDPAQCAEFAARLNKVCAGEAWWTPLNPASQELFAKMADGEFLCRLLNKCEAGSVPDSVLAAKAKKQGATTAFHNADTVTHFIASARRVGLEMVGLGATDFTKCVEEHKEHLVMGALWQLLKRQLANEIKAILARQAAEAEARGRKLANYSALMAMVLKDPEAYLVQWVNDTLREKGKAAAGADGKGAASMAELSLGTSDALLRLMHALDPSAPSTQPAAFDGAPPQARAALALDWVTDHAIAAVASAEDLLGSTTSVLMPFVLQIFTFASQQPGKESMSVLRSHSHVPSGDAGRIVSGSVCLGVYKQEADAMQCVCVCGVPCMGAAPLLALTLPFPPPPPHTHTHLLLAQKRAGAGHLRPGPGPQRGAPGGAHPCLRQGLWRRARSGHGCACAHCCPPGQGRSRASVPRRPQGQGGAVGEGQAPGARGGGGRRG